MADRFEDHRGVIQDLLITPLDGVTEIFTRKDAVRGNHVHAKTHQWTYIVSGRLLAAHRDPGTGLTVTRECGPRMLVNEPPGIPHAWRALEDCTVLVFTRGPRSGENYESDTRRLEVPLL